MMEDKDAVAAEKSAPEVEAAGQLSEDELNTVAGGISVHPDTFVHNENFVNKFP